MNFGKAVCFATILVLSVMSGAIMFAMLSTSWMESASPLMRAGVSMTCLLVGGLLIVGPFGLVYDISHRQLVARARHALDDSKAPEEFRAAWFLRPVARAYSDVCTQAWNERHELMTGIRDLEVAHRATQAEQTQLTGVLDAINDAIIVTDPFDEIMLVNEAAGQLLEVDIEQSKRRHIREVSGDDRIRQAIIDTREAGSLRNSKHFEHEIETSGRFVPYEVTISCIPNLQGGVGAVVAVLHDLSREREISQMKSDFVSKASHELRTPLSSIRAYVEMLVDGEATDEEARREFYGVIQNETDRLGRLIDNMLNISRIEAGIVQIEREDVDMAELINRAIETLEPQAKLKNQTLHNKIAPVALSVEGDGDMLYQVILNLGSNAVKYTPEGGRITFSADSDNLTRSAVVSVTDTGFGIPPDAIPKLFDKFYRVESFKRVAKGTGLGLNLCKHIVETVHHGQIGIESELGMGSRFWFSIPMCYAGLRAA